jgi:hypothetical protein
MDEQFTAKINARGILESPHVDFGKPLVIVHRRGRYLVVRCAGHGFWKGRGQRQEYVPTEYMLLRMDRTTWTLNGVQVEKSVAVVVRRAKPGREWKPCLLAMKMTCDELDAKQGAAE